jgi:alkylation response protein AidB-like acyl-CoA dehydrogenase
MNDSFPPLFPGLLLDAAERFAQDHASTGMPPATAMAELGWTLTLLPEAQGGLDGTLADLGAIVEGLAGHGLWLPVTGACATVPLLLRAAEPALGTPWLQALAEGSATLAPLSDTSGLPADTTVLARPLQDGFVLDGEVLGVDNTLAASHHLLVAHLADGEPAVFVLPHAALAPPALQHRGLDGHASADHTVQGLWLPAQACLLRGEPARQALAAANHATLLLGAVDTVATLAALIRHTVAHLQQRRQFGVALASFQALRHRVADMYVRYRAAQGLLTHAWEAWARDADDLERTLRLTKLALADGARACAEAAIQLHGGMGLSEEVLATRLAQRLLASEFRAGDRLTQLAWLRDPLNPRSPP